MKEVKNIVKEDEVDVMLFSLSINSKTLMNENVESITRINGLDYMTEDEHEEVKQLLAEAAGIIIERLQEANIKAMKAMVNKVKN